jgi:hypothetical protein
MDDPILDYKILEAVHEKEGTHTQRDISAKVGRSLASVNFALRLLAVKGFIKISGANPRNLKYHLTPQGVVQKSSLAYNFLKRQSALYEDVRTGVLRKLAVLRAEGVSKVALYGWTPFTEAAMLYLLGEGIGVTALYVRDHIEFDRLNRIPVKSITEFQDDCEYLVLTEPLAAEYQERIVTRRVVCFPESEADTVAP